MFHSSSRTADKFAEEYDRHGDSYTENATSESLKKVFENVQGNVRMQELDGSTDSKWFRFGAVSLYLAKEGRNERENTSFGTIVLQSQTFSHLADLVPSYFVHLFQNECSCRTFLMKMNILSYGFSRRLVLTQRLRNDLLILFYYCGYHLLLSLI